MKDLFSLKNLKNFFIMTVGCIILAAGVYFFKIPNGFATGGVSGVGTILAQLSPISAGAWIWILNGVLLVLGFIFLGRQNGIMTVYCSMFYSAVTYVLEIVVPLDKPLSDEPLLELIYAMLLTSIGSALIFNSGSSSGGTDIAALILKKYTSIDVGKALLITDFIVAAGSFFVFSMEIGLFSLLGLFAKAFIVDSVIESFNTCKYFVVITSKQEEISQYIMETLHHGVTTHKVIGEYTGEERTMIHTVCKRIEAVRLRTRIKELDPHSFIIVSTSSEIIGRGFRSV
ncbi:MAG: YitT family protein [Ruminococcaceae bacterium]|nr:YitT family protein [Oscillospiraceae bacterium]